MNPQELYNKIQVLVQNEARQIAEQVYNTKGTLFGVAQIPDHDHNGISSNAVPFDNIVQRNYTLTWNLPGITPQTTTNYGVIFTAPFACTVLSATEVHQTAGSDGSAVTLQLEKLTGTTAPGGGTVTLGTAFNLRATANTVQTSFTLNTAPSSGIRYQTLAIGDRLALKLTGTPTAVANVTVVITIQF